MACMLDFAIFTKYFCDSPAEVRISAAIFGSNKLYSIIAIIPQNECIISYYNVQNNLQQMKLELLYFLLISCQIDHLKNLLYSVI